MWSGSVEDDGVDRTGAYAVIGAGPHGLSALKALLQNGIDADGFEREAEVGGNWNYGAENSRVYQSTHLISSKPFTQFPDFPMPDRFPDYPSHAQIKEYFASYARHFGLLDRIRFQTDVVRVTPVDGGPRWLVATRDRTSGIESEAEYAGVVIANGHNWNPKMPHYPGQGEFRGEIIHSAQYKGADILRGRRVLVVGAGNTGCDVAVDSAQNAAATWHSTRRGYYYNPKFVMGRPSDQTADLLLALRLPLAVRRQAFKTTLKLTVGDFAKFGLKKPDHEFFETHPIVNQQLVYYVGHGDITPVDDIDHFDADGVVFTDGRRADVDLVVFCTGYLVTFPFLPDAEEQAELAGRPSGARPADVHPAAPQPLRQRAHPARQRPVDARPLAGDDDRPVHRGDEGAAGRRRPLLPRRDRRGRSHLHRGHDLQGLESPLLRGRPSGLPGGAAVSHPPVGGGAMSAAPRRRRTRVMRPWDWSLPSRPVSHREVISAQPAASTGKPPLLMVHGIAHAAWCFGENWVPAAAEAGYPSHALSLRGHGGSAGGRYLRRTTTRDYVHDVMQTITECPSHPCSSATRWGRSSLSSWPSGIRCAVWSCSRRRRCTPPSAIWS